MLNIVLLTLLMVTEVTRTLPFLYWKQTMAVVSIAVQKAVKKIELNFISTALSCLVSI